MICDCAFCWFVLVKACYDGVVYVVGVGWLILKFCFVEIYGLLFVMCGSSVLSMVFTITERSEMCLFVVFLYDGCKFPCVWDYVFYLVICGTLHVDEICESQQSDVFELPYIDFVMPCGVVVFALFIASWTCVVVSVIMVVCSVCVFLSMCCVSCVGELFAECVWIAFSMKIMVLFCVVFPLLANPYIVFQRLCAV